MAQNSESATLPPGGFNNKMIMSGKLRTFPDIIGGEAHLFAKDFSFAHPIWHNQLV